MNIFLETFGCQMNKLDSELVTASLRTAGHVIVADARDADVVLYNTCSVRRHAEQKVLSRLGADAQRKSSGRRLIVGVLGCMAQRMGGGLAKRYPAVDVVCGPGQLHRLPEMLAAADGAAQVALDPTRRDEPDTAAETAMDNLDLTRPAGGGAQAFVRIMRGCNFFCSYCIVPYVRGPERSRDPQHVADEVARLVDAGATEITLLGQTVNRYCWTGDGRTVRFSDLLERLSDTAGLRRLRFVTSHPLDFGDDVLTAMRDLPNVCEYIHCPAQSGSDRMLSAMNRRYSRAQYDDLVDRARAIVPGVVLAGDFIVGFPGETDADHAASADLVRRSGYKNCFVFKYSPRPGTAAAKTRPDDVPPDVKKQRNNDLLAVTAEVGLAHHRQYIGQAVEVLVEGPSPRARKDSDGDGRTQLTGRTRGDHIVVFDAPADARPETLAGHYLDVTVTDATALTLFGRCETPA